MNISRRGFIGLLVGAAGAVLKRRDRNESSVFQKVRYPGGRKVPVSSQDAFNFYSKEPSTQELRLRDESEAKIYEAWLAQLQWVNARGEDVTEIFRSSRRLS